LFIERAIFINYLAYMKNNVNIQRDFQIYENKSSWVSPENKLISFRTDILPFLADFSAKIQKEPQVTLINLLTELETKAR
jgi:hypothetical protein